MSRAYFYLTLHAGYARFLGGLRWAADDAIVEADGSTFAVSAEVAALIEGLAAGGAAPFHFELVLHLLHLLGRGKKPAPPWTAQLREAFARSGRSLSNAGAFFAAVLDLPRVAAPIDVAAVLRRLRGVPSRGEDVSTFDEEPPVSPEELEASVLRALEDQTRASLEHWLAHGRPPVRAERVAEEIARLPRSLEGTLAAALRRPRLEGAVPFVGPLVSALALPRRELRAPELPLGGYVDVTTRGGFDQILASQLVLDDLEFVRRFAANELLYYRREEPHAERHEELVLLLDQGARTWGFVRVVLAAACVAFGKSAARRKLPFLLATTATGGRLTDPLAVPDEAFAQLLGASDFSANPGLALERLLEAPSRPGRDVVLLTHARSVRQGDVLAAARRAGAGCRVFALGVEDDGAVALHELRHGAPVVRTRFRVDPALGAAEQPVAAPPAIAAAPSTPWTGDVEPIGYPFRFGLTGTLHRHLAFDRSGTWVLVSGRNGMLHAARSDGSRFEVLPRGITGEPPVVLGDAAEIFGESDGFVVVGRAAGRAIAVHYDFVRRRVKARSLAQVGARAKFEWSHFPHLRSVVARVDEASCYALDIDAGGASDRSRAASAAVFAGERGADQRLAIVTNGTLAIRGDRPSIELGQEGDLAVRGVSPPWQPFAPRGDGRPELGGHVVLEARLAGSMLGAMTAPRGMPHHAVLRLFRGPEGAPFGTYETKPNGSRFALSPDGSHVAREIGPGRVEVRETRPPGHVFFFPSGRFHHDTRVELGSVWILIISGRYRHRVLWHGGALRVDENVVSLDDDPPPVRIPAPGQSKLVAYDPSRFGQVASCTLTVAVDRFGQVAVLDAEGERLLVVFFAYRRQLAAWMPDGTRFGSTALLDGPPTPGAAERIGHVLWSEYPMDPRESDL